MGLTVRCPRCDDTFLAIEEAAVVESIPSSRHFAPSLPPEPGMSRPRRQRMNHQDSVPDRALTPTSDTAEEHDPHRYPPGTLPASVLIGLALLPFAIPILWLVAPAIIGKAPAVSIATPLALALSASILCLAVIYTVDWTPSTRIKGVLILVGLAYFGAASLYFIKKDMVEWMKRNTRFDEKIAWQEFETPHYRVKMPVKPLATPERPATSIPLDCYVAIWDHPDIPPLKFVVGSGVMPAPAKGGPAVGTDDWFNDLLQEIELQSGGKPEERRIAKFETKRQHVFPGRKLSIQFPDDTIRLIQLFPIKGRLYYQSIEGVHLNWRDTEVMQFFGSLRVPGGDDE